jgi:hypothetical protein
MAEPTRERPAIHVCLFGPSEPGLYRWVEIGAEEEGLPTRHVDLTAENVVAAAYAAAQSSRLDIGVAIGQGQVVLHEAHMPPAQPVLAFTLGSAARQACRLMGGNAARLVVRLPLRLAADRDDLPDPASRPTAARSAQPGFESGLDPAEVTRIVRIVTRILRERGIA